MGDKTAGLMLLLAMRDDLNRRIQVELERLLSTSLTIWDLE